MCALLTLNFCLVCHVQVLVLNKNKISDAGLTAFAKAVESGALPQLKELNLYENQIGDVGMQAFAGAVSKGALASLKILVVDNEEHPALKAACQARGIDL